MFLMVNRSPVSSSLFSKIHSSIQAVFGWLSPLPWARPRLKHGYALAAFALALCAGIVGLPRSAQAQVVLDHTGRASSTGNGDGTASVEKCRVLLSPRADCPRGQSPENSAFHPKDPDWAHAVRPAVTLRKSHWIRQWVYRPFQPISMPSNSQNARAKSKNIAINWINLRG